MAPAWDERQKVNAVPPNRPSQPACLSSAPRRRRGEEHSSHSLLCAQSSALRQGTKGVRLVLAEHAPSRPAAAESPRKPGAWRGVPLNESAIKRTTLKSCPFHSISFPPLPGRVFLHAGCSSLFFPGKHYRSPSTAEGKRPHCSQSATKSHEDWNGTLWGTAALGDKLICHRSTSS